ncbi:P-loop containing nucleoside triphosphate hydrolase protein [Apiospora sp. TS-2023a]
MATVIEYRLSAKALAASALAVYILSLLRTTKTLGPRQAQLLLHIQQVQQVMLKVPGLYKLATNHQLAMTAPLWVGSAVKIVQTLISRYHWLKNFVLRSMTVSVKVPAQDTLYHNIRSWIAEKELPKRSHYSFTAAAGDVVVYDPRTGQTKRTPPKKGSKVSLNPVYKDIQIWEGWRPFWIYRDMGRPASDRHSGGAMASPPLFESCQLLAEKRLPNQTDVPATRVYSTNLSDRRDALAGYWGNGEHKAMRRLNSVYIDEKVKSELLTKIRRYLDPHRSQLYAACSVPRRLGLLFHGPPGTGKTSLTLALAGEFQLPLFILDVPNLQSDAELKAHFKTLPKDCFVLLEDIDCVGSTKRAVVQEAAEVATPGQPLTRGGGGGAGVGGAGLTLSGLLNVIDGPDSTDGRILIMSSNHPEQLDPALIRPGRVDQKIYLGCISQKCAQTMFFEIYVRFRHAIRKMRRVEKLQKGADDEGCPSPPIVEMTDEDLHDHAVAFGASIPPGMFTPAELQVHIFDHEESPCAAVEGLNQLVTERVGAEQRELN